MITDHFYEALGSCQLLLPKTVFAAPGQEANLYFDNVVLAASPERYIFDVVCEKGAHETRRWVWTPGEEPGDYPLQIEVRDWDDNILATGTTCVHVARANAGANRSRTLLCIGDSLTAAGIYTGELLRLCNRPGNPALQLLGTRRPDPAQPANRNEGYGGWRFETFLTRWEDPLDPATPENAHFSPFLFLENGRATLDFARYIEEKLQGLRPDYITIMLGINDVFLVSNENRREAVDKIIDNAHVLVNAIRAAIPEAKLGLATLVPPSVSQDSFGATNGTMQNRWTYLKNRARLNLYLMQAFGGREAENISLIPTAINLDNVHNFPTVERAVNARSDIIGPFNNDEVHPAPSGYRQIADSIYAWLKWQEEQICE